MTILVSPSYYKQRKAFYGDYCTVKPLLLKWNSLTANHIKSIMRLKENDNQLYAATMLDLLRRYLYLSIYIFVYIHLYLHIYIYIFVYIYFFYLLHRYQREGVMPSLNSFFEQVKSVCSIKGMYVCMYMYIYICIYTFI
jgi:hypothetical protein